MVPPCQASLRCTVLKDRQGFDRNHQGTMASSRSFRSEPLVFGAIGRDRAASHCQHLRPIRVAPHNAWGSPEMSNEPQTWEARMDLTIPPVDNDFEVVGLLNDKTDESDTDNIGVKLMGDGSKVGGSSAASKGPELKKSNKKIGPKKKAGAGEGSKSKKSCSEAECKKLKNKIASQASWTVVTEVDSGADRALRLTGQQHTIAALNETIRKQQSTMAVMQGALSKKSRELDRTKAASQPPASSKDQAIKDALKASQKRELGILERLDGLEKQVSALSADDTQNQRRLHSAIRSMRSMVAKDGGKAEEADSENKRTPQKSANESQGSDDATLRRVHNLQTFLRKEKEERERAQQELVIEREHTKRLCEKLDEVEDAHMENADAIQKFESKNQMLAEASYEDRMAEVDDDARVTQELKTARDKAKQQIDKENAHMRAKMKEMEEHIMRMKKSLGIDSIKAPPPSQDPTTPRSPVADLSPTHTPPKSPTASFSPKEATSRSPSASLSPKEATPGSPSASLSPEELTPESPTKGAFDSLMSSHQQLMARLEAIEKSAAATRERLSSSRSRSRGRSMQGASPRASTFIVNPTSPPTQPSSPSSYPHAIYDPTRDAGALWDSSCDVDMKEVVNDASTVQGHSKSRAESVTKKLPGLLEAQKQWSVVSPARVELSSDAEMESDGGNGGPPSRGVIAWMENHQNQGSARHRLSRNAASEGSDRKQSSSITKLRDEYVRSKELESKCHQATQ